MHRKIITTLFALTLSWPALAIESSTYRGINRKAWVWTECKVSTHFTPDGRLRLQSFTDSNHVYNLWAQSSHTFMGEDGRMRTIAYLKFDYKDSSGTWIYQSEKNAKDATIEASLDMTAEGTPVAFSLEHKSMIERPDWGNEIQCEDLKPAP